MIAESLAKIDPQEPIARKRNEAETAQMANQMNGLEERVKQSKEGLWSGLVPRWQRVSTEENKNQEMNL